MAVVTGHLAPSEPPPTVALPELKPGDVGEVANYVYTEQPDGVFGPPMIAWWRVTVPQGGHIALSLHDSEFEDGGTVTRAGIRLVESRSSVRVQTVEGKPRYLYEVAEGESFVVGAYAGLDDSATWDWWYFPVKTPSPPTRLRMSIEPVTVVVDELPITSPVSFYSFPATPSPPYPWPETKLVGGSTPWGDSDPATYADIVMRARWEASGGSTQAVTYTDIAYTMLPDDFLGAIDAADPDIFRRELVVTHQLLEAAPRERSPALRLAWRPFEPDGSGGWVNPDNGVSPGPLDLPAGSNPAVTTLTATDVSRLFAPGHTAALGLQNSLLPYLDANRTDGDRVTARISEVALRLYRETPVVPQIDGEWLESRPRFGRARA